MRAPSKRAIRRCLSRVLDECEVRPSFYGEPFRAYCAAGNHMKCLQVLSDRGFVHLQWLDDQSPYPLYASCNKGALAELYRLFATRREKIISFCLGVVTGAGMALLTAWLTSLF